MSKGPTPPQSEGSSDMRRAPSQPARDLELGQFSVPQTTPWLGKPQKSPDDWQPAQSVQMELQDKPSRTSAEPE
jgi:hypothetical protein